MSISVCMASYNGEKFIARQLESILEQLGTADEVIVVDDCSTDGTVDAVKAVGDRRVTVHVNNRNRGEVYSFSSAMLMAKNDVLFLSDQDDIWMPGRVSIMRRRLEESGAEVVSSNFEWMDDNENPIFVPYDGVNAKDSKKYLGNIADIFLGRTNYFGCAMAMRREFIRIVAPIPEYVESHDLWIALASNLVQSNLHIDDKTLRKRKHANNATSTVSTRSLYMKLRSRMIFARSLLTLYIRWLVLGRG